MPDYDVIVIGSGAAGLSAAVAAASQGASVLVVEADTQVGGSSRLSGGHFYAAGTPVQTEAGELGDSADAMFEHYMTLNQWRVAPSVVRRYCDLSAPTFEWLMALGVAFDPAALYASGVGSTRRGHPSTGGGEAVIHTLHAHCDQTGVDISLGTRVDALLTDEAGQVIGIRSGEVEATCHAVIVASGGFGANPEMLAEHLPDAADQGDWTWYIGSPHAQGDGLKLGQQVGARLEGHNRGLLLVTPGFSRDLEVLLPPWVVLVNQRGQRFVNENAPYTVLAGLIKDQHGPVFALFDDAALQAAKPSAFSQAFWVRDTLQRKIDEGVVHSAPDLAALAAAAKIDADALQGSVARYNQNLAERQEDAEFFKSGGVPVAQGPFYAAEVRPAIVCWTGTGLRVNADTQVISERESPIPGLYAAGETVGSLHGPRYIGGGGSFGPCIVFGKLAGEQAAAFAHSLHNQPA